MLTGLPAWQELVSPLQVMFAVGVERQRLPIPAGCPPALARLLKECWRHNPPLRPSFPEVLARLRKIRAQDSLLQLQPVLLKHSSANSSPSKAPTLTGAKPLFSLATRDTGHIMAV